MALELVVQKQSISSDCATLTVEDATGNYDAATNPGGYGAPNEDRANLRHKLLVTLKKEAGNEAITVPDVDESTVSTWEVTIEEDGNYELFLFSTLPYNAATTYAINHITYDSGTDEFYKSLQNSNLNNPVSDPTFWEVADDVDDYVAAIDSGQPDAYSDIENIVELCNSIVCVNKLILNETKCTCTDEDCIIKDYEKGRTLIEAAQILEAQQSFSQAQTVVARLQELCANTDGCSSCN